MLVVWKLNVIWAAFELTVSHTTSFSKSFFLTFFLKSLLFPLKYLFLCGANSSKLLIHICRNLPMPSQSTLIFSVHNWEKREYYINWEYYINAWLVFWVFVKCCFFSQNFKFIRITKNLHKWWTSVWKSPNEISFLSPAEYKSKSY